MVVGFAIQYALAIVAHGQSGSDGAAPLFSSFNAAHFLPNYLEQGFIKRALIGTLFTPWSGAAQAVAVIGFNIAVLVTLAVFIARILAVCSPQIDRSGRVLLAALWVGAPAGVINLGYDFGRLDHVNFILLGMSLVALHLRARIWPIAPVCICTITALLVHEAYLFYGVALLMAVALVGVDSPAFYRRLERSAWIGLSAVLTLLVLWRWGRYEAGRAAFVASLDGAVEPSHNVLHVWFRSLPENLAYVGARLSQGLFKTTELGLFVGLLIAMFALLIAIYRANNRRLDLAALAPLGVLPLFALGVDYARWTALFWLAIVTIITHGVATGRFQRLLDARVNVGLAVVIGASMLLGPIGTVHLFPLARVALGAD